MSDSADVLQDNRRGAILSDDRKYRYRLWRTWDVEKPALAWIMLNPATADETEDDPTLRRCVGYAKDWGYGKVILGNLFAYRSSEPSDLWGRTDIVGPENDEHLESISEDAEKVVAGWGSYGDKCSDRADHVAGLLDADLYTLGTTQSGQPVHPLFQPADAEPVRWSP